MHPKISSEKWRPSCPGGDELICCVILQASLPYSFDIAKDLSSKETQVNNKENIGVLLKI